MYCGSCGRSIPNGSRVCNYCGQPQMGGGYPAYPRKRIDNIFSALVHERTPGAIMEFVLWCITCVIAVMAMIAAIVGHGKLAWIFLMIFAMGLAVITAFRLKPIALLYSVGVFNLIVCAIHFPSFRCTGSSSPDAYFQYSASVFNIILFVVAMLLAVGIVTCAFIHFFSRVDLGNIMTILVCVDTGVLILLHILMYAVPYTGSDGAEMALDVRPWTMNYYAYWFGTIVLWMMLIVVLLYYIFFFWGAIDSSKGKILSSLNGYGGGSARVSYPSGGASRQQVNAGLQGVAGLYTGQTIYLQGRTVTIGSGPQVVVNLNAAYVSGQHCAVRFNNMSGYYEIYDNSKNGVLLSSGKALQKGVYNSVARGEIISIGSNEQRFRLL